MAKRFAVLGLGRFGTRLAMAIQQRGCEVIAADEDLDRVEEVMDKVSVAVQMDCTDRDALVAQGIHQVDVAAVCIGDNFEANILCTMLLKDLGVPRVLSRAAVGVQTQILQALAVERVIHPEEEVADKLAETLTFDSLIDYLQISPRVNVAQVKAPKRFWSKTIQELGIRQRYGVTVVVIRRAEEKEAEEVPEPGTEIREGDILIVVGHPANIQKLAGEGQ